MNLRDELLAIYVDKKDLSPRVVVEAARPESHPLHSRFVWDDTEAADKYRLVQAAELIRSVRVVYKENAAGVESRRRAFVSTGEPTRPSAYLPTEEAMADPVTRELVLRQFERAIQALKRQYGHLKEFDAMIRKLLEEEDAAA